MTRSQLNNLYNYTGLPYSEELEALAEVRKVLLLELKSSDGGVLEINGKLWSKNDLLDFFDSGIVNAFDYEGFVRDYPWVRNLEDFEKITYDPKILHVDFSDPRFAEFAKHEGKNLEESFFLLFKRYIREQDDYYAAALLLYKSCFSTVFQMRLYREGRSMMTLRFNEILAISEGGWSNQQALDKTRFLKLPGYYVLMKELGAEDPDLLLLNLQVFSTVIKQYALRSIESIVRDQLKLDHSIEGREYLKRVSSRVTEVRQTRDSHSSSRSSSSGKNSKAIYGWIAFAVIFIRILLLLGRHSSSSSQYNYESNVQQRQMIQEMLQDMEENKRRRELIDSMQKVQDSSTVVYGGEGTYEPLEPPTIVPEEEVVDAKSSDQIQEKDTSYHLMKNKLSRP